MPCYRCAARQVDPDRGSSPWKRGVRRGEQVLICPDCQRGSEWTAELDRCASCGSTVLVRVLGETTCRACGRTGDPVPASPGDAGAPGTGSPAGLADEVAAALERLRRGPDAPA